MELRLDALGLSKLSQVSSDEVSLAEQYELLARVFEKDLPQGDSRALRLNLLVSFVK